VMSSSPSPFWIARRRRSSGMMSHSIGLTRSFFQVVRHEGRGCLSLRRYWRCRPTSPCLGSF
jgi:hypothetical protein